MRPEDRLTALSCEMLKWHALEFLQQKFPKSKSEFSPLLAKGINYVYHAPKPLYDLGNIAMQHGQRNGTVATLRNSDLILEDVSKQRLHDYLSALSDKSCLLIFELASKGSIASKTTLRKLKLSESSYYRKRKQLCDIGLLMRVEEECGEEVYKLTPLGEIVYRNQIVTLKRIAADNNMMDIVSKLVIRNESPNEGFRDAIRDVSLELLEESEDTGLWNLGRLRFFETIQDYDSYLVNCASGTKSRFYLASRSLDVKKVEAIRRASERGAEVKVIYKDWRELLAADSTENAIAADPLRDLLIKAGEVKVPDFTQRLQFQQRENLLSASNVSICRTTKIPYGFVVSDNSRVGIEIADPEDRQSFFAAFGLESSELALKLVSFFDEIVRRSEKYPC